MERILGIDHPLIAVRDIKAAIKTYKNLGFFIAPPGQHPWGTATALALFHHQLLEIVSIGDPGLLDGYETNGFRFGRHVETFLAKSEGVALCALFTEDAERDEQILAQRDIVSTGTVNFGRDVTRSDGEPDRTKTTLKVFQNFDMPRLSVFACQQHRRDLLEFPDRMVHPNGAYGFEAATIVCGDAYKELILNWLLTLHGSELRRDHEQYDIIPTTNGVWRIVSENQFEDLYQAKLDDDFLADGPRIAALDVRVRDFTQVMDCASEYEKELLETPHRLLVNDMSLLGGIAMGFVTSSAYEGN